MTAVENRDTGGTDEHKHKEESKKQQQDSKVS